MKKWLYAAVLCLIAAIVAGGLIGQAGAENGKDMLAIAGYAEEQMEGSKDVTIRFGGELDADVQAEGWLTAGKRLSRLLDLKEEPAPAGAAAGSGDGGTDKAMYRAGTILPYGGGSISLVLFDTGEGKQGYAVVKRELKADRLDGEALAEWQRQVSEMLLENGLHGKWNIAVQGLVSEKALGSGEKTDALLKRVGQYFHGKELERYTDNGTVSVTFSSKKLKGSVRSGMYRVSLQAALHKQSQDGRWRLTIGTPVITTEY